MTFWLILKHNIKILEIRKSRISSSAGRNLSNKLIEFLLPIMSEKQLFLVANIQGHFHL